VGGRLAIAASSLGLLFLAGSGPAAPSAVAGALDQQQTDGSGASLVLYSGQSVAQTFTAGLSGGLDQVDLYLAKSGPSPTGPLIIEIRNVFGTGPGNAVLASFSVPDDGVPTGPMFVSIPLAPPAPVAAGTQYAIVAHSVTDHANRYRWLRSSGISNPYTAGESLVSPQSPPLGGWSVLGGDNAFRTYVVPNAAPADQRASALGKCAKKFKKKLKNKHLTKERKKSLRKKLKRCKKRARRRPAQVFPRAGDSAIEVDRVQRHS
jgi:hypothetical protein